MDTQAFLAGVVAGVVGGSIGAMSARMVRERWGNRGWWVLFALVAGSTVVAVFAAR